MSSQITTAMVKGYHANVWHLAQQKKSRLAPNCRQEVQAVKEDYWDSIGAVESQEKVGRHSDVEYSDTPHGRRRNTLKDRYYADLVDKEDKIRLLQEPESEYVAAAVMSLNRYKDDEVIRAALGTAYSGEEGATPVSLANANKVAAFDGSSTSGVNLNVLTLTAVAAKFDSNEVDEDEPRHIVISSSQKQSLLNQEKATSQDYASVKALVKGEIDQFMGFTFHRSQRLPRSATDVTYTASTGAVGSGSGTITAANSRRCFAWVKSGILFATGRDITTRLSEIATKHYSVQVYAAMSIGATRMEESKVVEVICSE